MKKKKILFVLNHFKFSNGVAATLRSLVQNINKEKYDIHILPLYIWDKEFSAPIESMATIHKGIGFYFKGLDKIVNRIPLKLLYRLFIKGKYDVEIAYQYGLSTKMIAGSSNPRKICWMHTYDAPMTLREFYKKYPKIITVAKIGSKKLQLEGFNNADYCYNIIDEEDLKEKASVSISDFNLKTNKMVIATVCRLDPDKAILRQIRCIEQIPNIENKCEFWIIGGGSEFLTAQKYVSDNKLDSFIKLLGPQNNPYKFLVNADLYLCASLREGFSTACQEAAILGIPVISTNVDGAQELIDIAECGCVIPNDQESITNNLSEILSNKNLISSWQQTAQKTKYRFYKADRINKIEQVIEASM